MSVGFPTDKANIDSRVGSLVIALRDQLDDILLINNWLNSPNVATRDADLLDKGYTVDDIADLRTVIGDLAKLARISKGQDTQASQSNFFFHAGKVTGLN